MRTTVILVRHGQTIWNKERRFQGQTDIPLSKEGIMQSKSLAKRIKDFKISKVYTSELKRAVKTAEIVARESKLAVDKLKDLNERNYGVWEGLIWEEMNKELKGKLKERELEITPKNAESIEQMQKRVFKAFNSIVGKHQGETVLIICHGIVIRILISHLTKTPHKEVMERKIPNTSLSIFHLEDNDIVIEEVVGDASHLNQ